MGKVSLIGRSLAREGAVFTYIGQADECAECKLAKICHGLESGKRYKVVKVREKEHDCPVHDKVVVVEVEEVPIEVSLPGRKAMEGAVVELDMEECPRKWCPNQRYCRRDLFHKGQKVTVIAVEEVMDCPRGLGLKKARVKPI
ncbi:MAG: UPF0179 family protein [Thermoplasmatota archaeon]